MSLVVFKSNVDESVVVIEQRSVFVGGNLEKSKSAPLPPIRQASQTEISDPVTNTSVRRCHDSGLCAVQQSDVSRLVRGRSEGKHDEVCEQPIIVIELLFPQSPTITNGVRSELEIIRLPSIRTQDAETVAIDHPADPHSRVSSDIHVVEFEIRKS
ncbi:hypothetical protein BLNAU_6880 [Blattamonas nauphoetae]|uniref:Uncharacterized protein n=1 Tax=Blattamonas nauphoetae TaxID=2049346 RepID=A0ABQ9Y365_9EUKA|nr:hypothetical protein BLNAU_6880 [Blattamonas nauphoetae]